jgi:methyl-accepting chemotaxis protein
MIIHKDEGKQVIAYSKKTRQGWTLLVQQDYDEAYAAADKARMNALILLVVTLLFVAAAAYFLAGRLATPIRRLTVVADEISCGKLDAKIGETGRQDEIGALARSIERMGVSLQMAFDRLRKR